MLNGDYDNVFHLLAPIDFLRPGSVQLLQALNDPGMLVNQISTLGGIFLQVKQAGLLEKLCAFNDPIAGLSTSPATFMQQLPVSRAHGITVAPAPEEVSLICDFCDIFWDGLTVQILGQFDPCRL